jgi:hypothetical protein
MPSLERRIAELERSQLEERAPCFWCDCEHESNASPVPCAHRNWKTISHEAALAELN